MSVTIHHSECDFADAILIKAHLTAATEAAAGGDKSKATELTTRAVYFIARLLERRYRIGPSCRIADHP